MHTGAIKRTDFVSLVSLKFHELYNLPCDIWNESPPVANIKLLIIPNKATEIASQMPATATINVGIPLATP